MPNFLTKIRVFSPFYFIFILLFFSDNQTQRLLIFLVFVILSVTDFFDGYLARKFNLLSNFGKVFDPVSDKILVSATLLYLMSEYEILLYPSMLIIFREFLIAGVREYSLLSKKGYVTVAFLSKIKTSAQFISISGLLADFFLKEYYFVDFFEIFYFLLWITVILTLFTGYEYCYKTYKYNFKDQK